MTTATATATKTKSDDPLVELQRLEDASGKVKGLADRLSRDHYSKLLRHRDLQDERRRLIHREPGLVDHTSAPIDEENAIASLDREIAGLGDLDDLGAQKDHAGLLAVRANETVRAYVKENYASVIRDLRGQGEARAAAANAGASVAREEAMAYVNFCNRVANLVHIVGGDTRSVPGMDAAHELAKANDGWDLPLPLPEVG